jgi:thioredoxin:protein disulfide reductase
MRIVLTLLTLWLTILAAPLAAKEPLRPDEAFQLTVTARDATTLIARWQISEGYYLYHNKITARSESEGLILDEPIIPPGEIRHDEFFGEVETHRGLLEVAIPYQNRLQLDKATLIIASQGCADIGICYPPQRQRVTVTLPLAATAGQNSASPATSAGALSPRSRTILFSEEDELLEPEVAFQIETAIASGSEIKVAWQIASGYYLYQEKMKFAIEGEGVAISAVELPQGKQKQDDSFGEVHVYYDQVSASVKLARNQDGAMPIILVVDYQGCAEGRVCYPPQQSRISLNLPPIASDQVVTTLPAATSTAPPLSEQDGLAAMLAGDNAFATLLLFFGLGLLLAFTPCVFPMIPILSSIIIGQGREITTRRAFTLSLVYVLAMALTYTVAGVIAGIFGANLQAAFQNPWVLSIFAAIFVALAMSMFGFYELQLPSALQSKLAEMSNRQQGGTLIGVAIMGLLSALIVGPCVAPPLMGALIYIGQTGDALLGGMALFALSLGMGAPLLAIGTSAGKYMPRAGGWMDSVKAVFGVMMLAVAIWLLERILPPAIVLMLWSLLLVTSAVYMGAFDRIDATTSGWKRLWKGLAIILLLHGALQWIGMATGSSDPLQPLKGLAAGSGQAAAKLEFQRVKDLNQLEQAIASAKASGRAVMLDFYADWCISCKELERYTFSDRGVIADLANVVLLKADVTANDAADQALLKSFGLIGPPAIIFYGSDGIERRPYRVVGFMDAPTFREHLRQALASSN